MAERLFDGPFTLGVGEGTFFFGYAIEQAAQFGGLTCKGFSNIAFVDERNIFAIIFAVFIWFGFVHRFRNSFQMFGVCV